MPLFSPENPTLTPLPGFGELPDRLLKNVDEAASTRRKGAKKRCVYAIHEHFEPISNPAKATQVDFQQPAKRPWNTQAAITLLAVLMSLVTCMQLKADSYRYVRPDGSVIFTDVRISSKALRGNGDPLLEARTHYNGSYGRPQASSSCNGVSEQILNKRYASIATTIERAAKDTGVEAVLLKAIARVESCFDPKAVSHAGARGIMQLMPATAKSLSVSNSFDPVQNIGGGARYFAFLLKRFEGNKELALAAYNAGPGAVDKYQGIPPYPETSRYVPKVLSFYQQFK